MTFEELQTEVYRNAKAKGFHDGFLNIPEKLALIHSEVSEALEACRTGNMGTVNVGFDGKPAGFPSELADVVIRCMDLAELLGINLWDEMVNKHGYNKTRSHRHGGKAF